MINEKIFLLLILFCVVLSACSPTVVPPVSTTTSVGTSTPGILPTDIPLPSPTVTNSPEPTPTLTSTDTPVPTNTSTATPAPTETPTITPAPTYVTLRGEVNVEHANCRYGPGYPYLYKYGLVGGSNLEIIRRLPTGTWIEVQAIGGNNPCWVNADLLTVKGDVMTVQPVAPEEVRLPFSPYYSSFLTGVSARRDGGDVTISWSPFVLRPGDDSEQYPYLIETWVCQNGELVFTPIGSYETAVTVTDEPGCSEPSWGRAYAVEKHGYTQWVKIPWPQAGNIPIHPSATP